MIAGRALGRRPPLFWTFPDMTDALPIGETALWRAVVLQAFQDATFGYHGVKNSRRKRRLPSAESQAHARTARSWLLGNSSDFRRVCDLAGLEPEAVQRAAKVAITSADLTVSKLKSQKAQPVLKKTADGERFFDRRPVGEGNIEIAYCLEDSRWHRRF